MKKDCFEKRMSILSHLSAYLTWFIGPLIIFYTVKNKTVKNHARHSINFQFTITILVIIAFLFSKTILGLPILVAIGIFNVLMIITAIIQIIRNKNFNYPLEIEFIK